MNRLCRWLNHKKKAHAKLISNTFIQLFQLVNPDTIHIYLHSDVKAG